jgi:anti-anti-sigma factor
MGDYPFSVQKRYGEDTVRLDVVGEIDEEVTDYLTATIRDTAGQDGVTYVVVDLRGVTFLAAAGIRSLLQGRAEALRRGCTYRVINADGLVHRVLRITGTAELLSPSDPEPAEQVVDRSSTTSWPSART